MTRYTVQLYADNGDRIHDRQIECCRKDVPGMLIGITRDCLEDASHTGNIQILVNSGWYYTLYLVLPKNGTLNLYRHMRNADGAEAQGRSAEPPASRDREGAAR